MSNKSFMQDLRRMRLEIQNRIYDLKKINKTNRASVYHQALGSIDSMIAQIKKHDE